MGKKKKRKRNMNANNWMSMSVILLCEQNQIVNREEIKKIPNANKKMHWMIKKQNVQ